MEPPRMMLVVRADEGDTIDSIAKQFGCDVDSLRALNPGVTVEPGTELQVPMEPTQCQAEPGDTLDSIAAQFSTTPEALAEANPGVYTIESGTILNIP